MAPTMWLALALAPWLLGGMVLVPTSVHATSQAAAPVNVERFVIVPSASEALYRVGETFFNRNNQFKIAIGTTHAIQGEILVDRAHPRQTWIGPVTVDLSRLASDSHRRDRSIRNRWLESAKYPTAAFTATAIEGLPVANLDGRAIPVRIIGSLRIRDVTKQATFAGTVALTGDTLTGKAATTILMTDFGFDPPSILGFLKAENQAELEIQFTAQRTP